MSRWITLLMLQMALVLLLACSGYTTDGDGDGDGDGDSDGDSDADGDTDADADFEECVALAETADNTLGPADVVIAIDNTPSMSDEIEEVRANMNRFSRMVEERGLNMHIVLIACSTADCLMSDRWHAICIDPPVGAEGACAAGTDDSNPPDYLHVNRSIPSTKGFGRVVETFAEWQHMLRDDSAKHVVMISDDGDEWSADQFDTAFRALDSRLENYQFHGIFSFMSKDEACAISEDEPCCTFAAPDGSGAVYRELVEQTEGVAGDLCLQDFDGVFDALAGAVVDSAELSCEWAIPTPPEDQILDPDLVNVVFRDASGTATNIGRVDSAEACFYVERGWYYGSYTPPALPAVILVCPQTCDWIQGQPSARVDIQFGCASDFEPLI